MIITEEELRTALEEIQQTLHQSSIKWNSLLCEELQKTHPFVYIVRLEEHSCTIHVLRQGTRYTHEITIYNERNHKDPIDIFKPKMSWFSSTTTAEDTSVLDYLQLLGHLAKKIQNFENSSFFSLLADYWSQYLLLKDQEYTLSSEISKITTARKKEQDQQALQDTITSLREMEPNTLFYKPIRRRIHNTVRGYEVVCIHKVNAKTVNFGYDKCYDNLDVNNTKDPEYYSQKFRRKFDYVTKLLKDYTKATEQELNHLVDSALIDKLIKEAVRAGETTKTKIEAHILDYYNSSQEDFPTGLIHEKMKEFKE